MLTISKPLSAKKIKEILEYYDIGTWHGKLANEWGLSGQVNPKTLNVLLQGFTPDLKQQVRICRNPDQMERRCAFDLTFSAPKSVSLIACNSYLAPLIKKAHEKAVLTALDAVEQYTQTRETTRRKDIVTRKWVTALYQHNETRGVLQTNSNPANSQQEVIHTPQLHTHCLLVNITKTNNNEVCAIDPLEIYKSCSYGTAIYRMILSEELQKLGIPIVIQGKTFCPEVKDLPPQYIKDASIRSDQIDQAVEKLLEKNPDLTVTGRLRAFLTHKHRNNKNQTPENTVSIPPEIFMERLEKKHGNHIHSLSEKVQHTQKNNQAQNLHEVFPQSEKIAQEAATYSHTVNTENESIFDNRAFFIEAIKYGIGKTTLMQISKAFKKNVLDRKVYKVDSPKEHDPSYWYTTRKMLEIEKQICDFVFHNQKKHEPVLSVDTIKQTIDLHPKLNESQRKVLEQVSENKDQIQAINGVAGAGKSYVVGCLQKAAESEGYQIFGFAPTTKAAKILNQAGLTSTTLQSFIARRNIPPTQKRLLIVDESSLAETRNMHELFKKLHPQDRVILLGDTRQLESVGAGAPFVQLQEHGMATSSLDEIVRQRKEIAPQLRKEVELLYQNKPKEALESIIERQGVIEASLPDSISPYTDQQQERRKATWELAATRYLKSPKDTIVVVPSNYARQNINTKIHYQLLENKDITNQVNLLTLNNRFDLSGEDRILAGNYTPGDILRFSRTSFRLRIKNGEYATVQSVDLDKNEITIELEQNGRIVTYNPKRFKSVTAYRPDYKKRFGVNELVQFTAPNKRLNVANRELGTIQEIDDTSVKIKLHRENEECVVTLTHKEARHIDYGYAITAMSAQGQTEKEAIFVVDSEDNKLLVNRRTFYVALSRATHAAVILTDKIKDLQESLLRKQDKTQAQKQYQISSHHLPEGPDPEISINHSTPSPSSNNPSFRR